MSFNEWAYDAAQGVPAQLVSKDTDALNTAGGTSLSRGAFRDGDLNALNDLDYYPTIYVGTPADRWWVRDPANDVFAYVTDASGTVYEDTQAFKEMTYAEAKAQARDDLEAYYQAYSTSQFMAGPNTFGAEPGQTISYLIIDTIIAKAETAGGYTPNSQVVFDLLGDAHPVASAAAWGTFWTQYENLFDTARSIVGTAWGDVKTATTTDEVRIIIAALPAIPGV